MGLGLEDAMQHPLHAYFAKAACSCGRGLNHCDMHAPGRCRERCMLPKSPVGAPAASSAATWSARPKAAACRSGVRCRASLASRPSEACMPAGGTLPCTVQVKL